MSHNGMPREWGMMSNAKLYEHITAGLKNFPRKNIRRMREMIQRLVLNPFRKRRYRKMTGIKVHVGCGSNRLEGFVNVDIRYTNAVDLAFDLNRFDFFKGNADLVFSHAFFEHLYRPKRLPHLKGAYEALSPEGRICYIGIPDFERIAELYLRKGPGTDGPLFDLFNVYRYTHGFPEMVPSYYTAQLHKSLFDVAELCDLLDQSGFKTRVLFHYAYPTDTNLEPINLGFYASKNPMSTEALCNDCIAFLKNHPDKVLMSTLDFIK